VCPFGDRLWGNREEGTLFVSRERTKIRVSANKRCRCVREWMGFASGRDM